MIRREKCFKRSLLWHLIKFLHRISAFLRVMFMFLEILYLKRGHGIEIHNHILHKSPVDRISCDQAGSFFLKQGYKNFHKLVLCNWKPPAASRAGQCNCHKGFSQIVIFLDPSCKMVQTELLCNFMVWHHNKMAGPPQVTWMISNICELTCRGYIPKRAYQVYIWAVISEHIFCKIACTYFPFRC